MKKSKKTFKRVLAIALAALMVGSSFPIASLAATDQDVNTLRKLTQTYENKMDGTIYTNMKPAYDAYIESLKLIDAYSYGKDTALDAKTQTSKLNSAINAMMPWDPTAPVASVAPSFSEDTNTTTYVEGTAENATHNNLIAAAKCTKNSGSNMASGSGSSNVDFKICYGEAVLVDDGITKPKVPVMWQAINHNKAAGAWEWIDPADFRYTHGTYPTNGSADNGDNTVVSLDSWWHGGPGTSTLDFAYCYANGNNGADWHKSNGTGYNYSNANKANFNANRREPGLKGTGKNSNIKTHQANTMTVSPVFDNTNATSMYLQVVNNISWYTIICGENGLSDNPIEKTFTTSTPLYVLNTGAIKDAISQAAGGSKLADTKFIKTDSAQYSAFLGAIDAATTFDVSDPSYVVTNADKSQTINADLVTAKANGIKTVVETINNTKGTFKKDTVPNGYANLREAIQNSAAAIAGDNADNGYTADSYKTFKDAYNSAIAKMKALPTSQANYSDDAQAQDLANTLNTAREGLKTTEVKVNTADLEVVIDNADVLAVTKNLLTSTKSDFNLAYNTLMNAVTNAKKAVWNGDVANYKNESQALKDTPENQQIVANHITAITNAFKDLLINFNAPVPSAKNLSLNALIKNAGTYVEADYANYAQLEAAVADAQNFIKLGGAFTPNVRGNAKGLVMGYVEKARAINVAINNLQPAFSKLTNGTIINSGLNQTSSFEAIMKGKQHVWGLSLNYMNDQVLFRTTNDPFNLDVSGFSITFTAPNNDYDQFLDSINLDETVDSKTITNTDIMWRPQSCEINSNNKEIAMSQIQKDTFKAGFSLVRGDATFSVDDVTVSEIYTNYQGRTSAGTDVALGEAHNWVPELSVVDGAINPCRGGVPVAKGNKTVLTANGHFSLPATTAPTLSASTKPTSTLYAPQDAYFSGIVRWSYKPNGASARYYGYGTDRAQWEPRVTVIDVSTLFTLMNQSTDIITNHRSEYTAESISALETALNGANAEFPYGQMNNDSIQAECVSRYDNLWTAYAGLKEAPKHQHNWGPWVSNNDGTHTRTCSAPGCTYQGGKETVNCNMVAGETVPPTCTEKGYTVYTCSDCKYSEHRDFVNALGHDYTGKPTYNGGETNKHTYTCNNGCGVPKVENCRYDKGVQTKAPTCKETGEMTFTCQDCGHTYTETIPATGNHTETNYPYVAPTREAVGYTGGTYCSVCNEVLTPRTVLDASAYFAAIDKADATKNDPDFAKKYPQGARDKFINDIKNAKLDLANPATTQKAIDEAADVIKQANTLIEGALITGYTVKLQAIVNGVEGEVKVVQSDVAYGTLTSVDATTEKGTGYISYWEVFDESTSGTTPMHTTKDVLDFTVTSDTTIKVYIADKPTDGKTYTKVTLYNELNSVYNVSYVENINTIDLSQKDIVINGTTYKAPAKPFYTFDRWTASTVDGEYRIVPNYKFIDAAASYSQILSADKIALIEGVQEYNSIYDKLVSITGGEAYAIVANNDPSQVITYVNADQIHVPHNDNVYITTVNKADLANATSGITGTLVKDRSAKYGPGVKGATFNCMFNLPQGAKLIECGAIGTNKVDIANDEANFQIGKPNVINYKSDSTSAFNEYNICFSSNYKPGSTFYGRSYIIYNDATGQHTVYGKMSQITL